jgi:hypothetical protein
MYCASRYSPHTVSSPDCKHATQYCKYTNQEPPVPPNTAEQQSGRIIAAFRATLAPKSRPVDHPLSRSRSCRERPLKRVATGRSWDELRDRSYEARRG